MTRIGKKTKFLWMFLIMLFILAAPQEAKAGTPQLTDANLQTIGGQIRTVNPMGLRMMSCVKDSYLAELEKQGQVEFGTIILPEKYLNGQELTADGKYIYNGKLFKPAVAKAERIFHKAGGRTYFTAVITNISQEAYEDDYAARAYIKLTKEDGSVEMIYSADHMEKQVYQVAKDAVEGNIETPEVKEWLDENVIQKVENPKPQEPTEEEEKVTFRMGNVESVSLYCLNKEGDAEEVGTFAREGFSPEKYIAKVVLSDQPTVFAEVEELVIDGDKAKLKLKLDGYTYKEEKTEKSGAIVTFGTVKDDKIVTDYESVDKFLERLKSNPSGHHVLLRDLDFSQINPSGDEIMSQFTGTLDGKGHKITGLKKTLFGEVSGGTVKNLVIENASVNKTGNYVAAGVLADVVKGKSTIENVHITGALTSNRNKTGGLIGELKEQSIVRYCSSNMTVKNTNNGFVTAGLVGETASQSQIYDCYAMGTVQSNAKGAGGLVGWHCDSSIERSYSAVQIISTSTTNYPGGFIGNIWDKEVTPGNIQKNVSFSYGKRGYKFDGMTDAKQFSDKYKDNYTLADNELTPDKLTSDSVKTGISVTGKITEKSLEELKKKEFYTQTLGWSEEVWDFSQLEQGKAPKIKGISPNIASMTQNVAQTFSNPEKTMEEAAQANLEKIDENVLSVLAATDGYQQEREKIYTNLLKFMPFYHYEQIIAEGNKIDASHKLNQYDVLTVYPLNDKGERIVAITADEAKNISKIRVQFAQDEAVASIYGVQYVNTKKHIASYQVEQIPVHYTFKNYVVNDKSEIFKQVVEKAKSYDYDKDIMNRVEGGEHSSVRNIYRKNYNNVVIPEMEKMFVSYFASHDELPVHMQNPIAEKLVKDTVLNEDYLKDYLCSYNYIDRWYDFSIGGVNLRDVILFDNDVTGKGKDAANLPIEMCHVTRNSSNDERWGRRTQDLYRNRIGKYTGIAEVADFVEFFMKAYAGYDDVNDWIMENFEYGVLMEAKPKNAAVQDKRLWERIKQNNYFWWGDLIIPTLSYKTSKNLFMGATTTYIVYGNLQAYGGYQDTDAWRQTMRNTIQNQLNLHANIFDHYATLSSRGATGINGCNFTVIDQNLTKDRWQDVFAEFYEPLSSFMGGGGNGGAAVAVRQGNGRDYIYFNTANYVHGLDEMTHELGHVTDSVIYMDGKGLRAGRNGEDVNNGFANQYAVDYNMNLMQNYSKDSDKLCNLTPDRIDTDEEFKSYYKGVFETLYTLDYLQGLAYLELTPEQQSAITAKHHYGKPNAHSTQNQVNSTWSTLSASELENMHLETIEDLWDNQLMIRPGHRYDIQSNNWVGQGNFGAYNLDRVAFASWYVPYVDNGSPNAQVYRRRAYELGGVAGYIGGTQEYLKSGGEQDLARWKRITKEADFNFKQWQMDRFDEVKKKIEAQKTMENPYFDADTIVDYLKQNMINYGNGINSGASNGNVTLQNIKNSRENIFRYLQRVTNQFTTPLYPTEEQDVVEVTDAQQLVEEMKKNPSGVYVLQNDISMENIAVENECYINTTFIGKIDGNGHTITGMKKPLLARISNSYVTDIAFAGENGVSGNLLAKSVGMTIQVTEKKEVKEIHTLEDLKSVSQNDYKKYVLKADIDASSVTSGDALIGGSFSTVFDGENHTIKGLKVPLFDTVDNGTIQNLKLKDAVIQQNKDYVAAVAKKTNHSLLENLNLENIQVEGQSYTASVTGRDYTASTYRKIQVRNPQIKASGNNSGGFIGRSVGTTVSDIAVLGGKVEVQKRGCGGFIGIAKDTKADKVYSGAELSVLTYTDSDTATAGFIGSLEGKSAVSHAFMAGNVDNKAAGKTFYKFTGTPNAIETMVTSSYELKGTKGESNIAEATAGKLSEATEENQKDSSFYKKNLQFAEETWSLDWVADKGYPELKGMESQAIIRIKTMADVERMKQHPNEMFILETDLDFTNANKTEPIIDKFGGVLHGNGHKITGLKKPFFNELSGTVENLFLMSGEGGLANRVKNATVSKVGLHQIKGENAVFAETIQDSQISDVQITDSTISAAGEKGAGFAVSVTDSAISNVVQKVDFSVENADSQSGFAGFVADTDSTSTFANIISVGNVSDNVPKLMKTSANITNGYEFAGADGLAANDKSRVTEIGEEIWTDTFYRNRMKLNGEIWDFSKVSERGYPTLKGMSGECKAITLTISKAEDFAKMNKLPSRTFTVEKDIDLTDYTGDLVTAKFTGTLNGNGHSISHQRKSLFGELAGTVTNLTLKDVLVVNENGAANAFARTATKATVKNVYVSGMTLSGGSHTGFIGTEGGSNYEQVGIENAKVEAKDNYAGIFIAETDAAHMSVMRDILIGNGEMHTTDKEYVGGFIGKLNAARMSQIVCDADLYIPDNMTTRKSAAFIGNVTSSISLSYSVMLGGVYSQGNSVSPLWKMTHIENTSVPAELSGWSQVYHDPAKPGTVPSHWSIVTPEVWNGGITSPLFYQNSLFLDATIWNIYTGGSKGYPILNGMPETSTPAPELPKR